jgi:hypothetical protein
MILPDTSNTSKRGTPLPGVQLQLDFAKDFRAANEHVISVEWDQEQRLPRRGC